MYFKTFQAGKFIISKAHKEIFVVMVERLILMVATVRNYISAYHLINRCTVISPPNGL